MKRYDPKEIEPRWQGKWAEDQLYKAVDFDTSRPKFTMLTEFPYPSGEGLHLGHVREYSLGDIIARHKRMTGHNVLYPMGYDAFGLPTENFAIKNKIAPQKATDQNVANFQKQFDSLGYSIDWSRSFRTTDPSYYKWTQWLFLQFFKAGLAYQDEIDINWCPFCKTGLANEEVINGRHERCDTLVEKKTLNQWLLRITDYADRLIDGLQAVDYPSRIADQQVNWIGRSQGAEVDFKLKDIDDSIKIFTTRPDTLFGASFMVLAPEHSLVQEITTKEQKARVEDYIKQTSAKSEIERQDEAREKTGVFTGAYAINPVNDQQLPIWIADYVLTGYGTGAIMAVPAHDQRDNEFALKFNLPITQVIDPVTGERQKDPVIKPKIVAVVQNSKGEVLTINWKPELGGRLLVGGGIEADEKPAETAMREIAEETGYTDLELISVADETVYHEYFAFSKQTPTRAITSLVHLKLVSDKQAETSREATEEGNFTVEWVAPDKAYREIHDEQHLRALDHFVFNRVYTGEGIMVNSGEYDGLSSSEMREKIVADLEKKGRAKVKINYRLRDWIFSRQHYWGEPIPIIHCPDHGAVPVPDDQLPVVLPEVEQYEPSGTGESPLASVEDWVNTSCPTCGKPAKRETDTMPNWAGSSWYYLRYYDAHNDEAFADPEKLKYWGEVDMYLGGMEHTTLHLLYSRFWHQFFYDQELVPTPEPYRARRGQGIILAADGTKMSKSKGNVVNPTEIIDSGYGADALRLAIAFLAPYDQTTPWSPETLGGTFRFLQRVWTLTQEYIGAKDKPDEDNDALLRVTHKAIEKVSRDVAEMGFNTSIAALMEFVNELYKIKNENAFAAAASWSFALKTLVQLMAPFAPHISEELWHELGQEGSVHLSSWPVHDPKYLISDTVTIAVQVNGKLRATLELPADSDEETVTAAARGHEKVKAYLDDAELRKTIYVPGKLVNLVVG